MKRKRIRKKCSCGVTCYQHPRPAKLTPEMSALRDRTRAISQVDTDRRFPGVVLTTAVLENA